MLKDKIQTKVILRKDLEYSEKPECLICGETFNDSVFGFLDGQYICKACLEPGLDYIREQLAEQADQALYELAYCLHLSKNIAVPSIFEIEKAGREAQEEAETV